MNGFNLSNIQDARLGATTLGSIYLGSSKLWPTRDYSEEYFTIESLEDSNIIKLYADNQSWVPNVEYSTNGGTSWTGTRPNTSGNSIATLNTGDTILIRSTTSAWYLNNYANRIIPSKTHKIYGNIMSLTYGDSFSNQTSLKGANAFRKLFYNNTKLTDASNLVLPATTITASCYYEMFKGCTSLVTAPKVLPALTLADYCYYFMFHGCTSLRMPCQLPATTLTNDCYESMFRGCTSLTTAPKLPATTLANYCYSYMFYGCSALTTAPTLPATTLANYCYCDMFKGCTGLTSAPVLSATTLADSCYREMFKGCSSLTSAPVLSATTLQPNCYRAMFSGCALTDAPTLPATTIADYCYYYMFEKCTSLINVQSTLPATTLANYCYSGMFTGCTSLTTAPELPATTLANYCYNIMFRNCKSLNYIKCLATNISATSSHSNWVQGVASTGTFVKPTSMTSWGGGQNGIPSGWTVVNI